MDWNDWYVMLALNVVMFASLWGLGVLAEKAFQFLIDNYEDIANGRLPKP